MVSQSAVRALVIVGGGALCAVLALVRVALGLAPAADPPLTPAILFHFVAMIIALPLGMWLLLACKGTRAHRRAGSLWMALVLASAASSFGIQSVRGGLSPIHLFAVWTLFSAPRAYLCIRRGDVAGHSRALQGLFAGAVLIAGAFTFGPGRILHTWAFG